MTNEEIIKGLQATNEHIGRHFNEGGAWMAEFIDNAIKALESQRWIPVSEPPKETGEYIVTIKWRNHYHYGDYKYLVVKRKYYADVKTWEDSLVIAYMPKPLPEPYKESDKSETN